MTNASKIEEIQQKNEDELLGFDNVVGVSIGNNIIGEKESNEQVLSVLVSQKLPKNLLNSNSLVPETVDGFKTDVIEVGHIFAGDLDTFESSPVETYAPEHSGATALKQKQEDSEGTVFAGSSPTLSKRVRPAEGGYSVGHVDVTAGTLGTCCYDLRPFPSVPGKYYILSNNHVLANSNNARIGDPILQPGAVDGGRFPRDVIAHLSRYVPIRFRTPASTPINYVDAAIAEGDLCNLDREIYWQGYIRKLYSHPKVGDIVQKTGRTTGFTTGRVTNINATVDVNYGGGRVARFARQIITTRMGAPGDSGSIVLNREEGGVGLLFAGSNTRTILNNLAFVQSLLNIRITEI